MSTMIAPTTRLHRMAEEIMGMIDAEKDPRLAAELSEAASDLEYTAGLYVPETNLKTRKVLFQSAESLKLEAMHLRTKERRNNAEYHKILDRVAPLPETDK